jgi:hypothetical protein
MKADSFISPLFISHLFSLLGLLRILYASRLTLCYNGT